MNNREEAIAAYKLVKESVKYAFPRWVDPETTKRTGKGHCGAKSELLVSLLRQKGIEARYVEGRPAKWGLIIMKLAGLDAHFWVEALVDNDWLTLDPAPDSGITHVLGDTNPGTHLSNPTWTIRWDELPPWYKGGYNMFLLWPFRFLTNIQLMILRLIRRLTTRN